MTTTFMQSIVFLIRNIPEETYVNLKRIYEYYYKDLFTLTHEKIDALTDPRWNGRHRGTTDELEAVISEIIESIARQSAIPSSYGSNYLSCENIFGLTNPLHDVQSIEKFYKNREKEPFQLEEWYQLFGELAKVYSNGSRLLDHEKLLSSIAVLGNRLAMEKELASFTGQKMNFGLWLTWFSKDARSDGHPSLPVIAIPPGVLDRQSSSHICESLPQDIRAEAYYELYQVEVHEDFITNNRLLLLKRYSLNPLFIIQKWRGGSVGVPRSVFVKIMQYIGRDLCPIEADKKHRSNDGSKPKKSLLRKPSVRQEVRKVSGLGRPTLSDEVGLSNSTFKGANYGRYGALTLLNVDLNNLDQNSSHWLQLCGRSNRPGSSLDFISVLHRPKPQQDPAHLIHYLAESCSVHSLVPQPSDLKKIADLIAASYRGNHSNNGQSYLFARQSKDEFLLEASNISSIILGYYFCLGNIYRSIQEGYRPPMAKGWERLTESQQVPVFQQVSQGAPSKKAKLPASDRPRKPYDLNHPFVPLSIRQFSEIFIHQIEVARENLADLLMRLYKIARQSVYTGSYLRKYNLDTSSIPSELGEAVLSVVAEQDKISQIHLVPLHVSFLEHSESTMIIDLSIYAAMHCCLSAAALYAKLQAHCGSGYFDIFRSIPEIYSEQMADLADLDPAWQQNAAKPAAAGGRAFAPVFAFNAAVAGSVQGGRAVAGGQLFEQVDRSSFWHGLRRGGGGHSGGGQATSQPYR